MKKGLNNYTIYLRVVPSYKSYTNLKDLKEDEIYSSLENDLLAAVRTRTKIILEASGDVSRNRGLILNGRAVKITISIKNP